MTRLTRLSCLILWSSLALTACYRSTSSQVPNRGLAPMPTFGSTANKKRPVFGNTASNLERIRQKPYNGTIRFVVLGDNRNSSPFSTGGDKVYAKVIEQINQLKPDFSVNLGDFTFDNLSPHWRDFERLTAKAQNPYLTVVGNHDVLFGRSYYESNYTPPHPETGLDDYSFDYGNTRFIALDTANFTVTDRQFTWLEKQLQTPLKKVLFSHTPPRHGVWAHKLSPSPEVSQRFLALNQKYQVDHVFLGHIHLYDQREVNGVNYIVSGGGGAPMDKDKNYGQSIYHVVLVEIKGDQLTTKMVPIQTQIKTQGPTSYTTGLDTAQLMNPALINKYPGDIIPANEQKNDR